MSTAAPRLETDNTFTGDNTFNGVLNLGGAEIIYEVPEAVDAQGAPVVWLGPEGVSSASAWTPSGGTAHTAVQATVGKQPTPVTGGDFNYYEFANVDVMTIAGVDGTAWTEATMIVVARETLPTVPHVGVIARLGGAGDGTNGTFGLHTYLQRIFGEGIAADTTPSTDSPVGNGTGQWHVYWVRRTATENWLGVDGMKGTKESVYTVVPLAIPQAGMAIGSDVQADNLPFVGGIACVIVDNTAWSFERLRAVSLGLCQQFGIAQTPQVWAFGDSLFNGWSNFYDDNNPIRLIGESFGYRTTYPVSRPGRKTDTAVAEFNDLVAPFIRPVNGVSPVVIFELGANDFLNSVAAATSYANLLEVSQLARSYGATVYIVTPAAAGVNPAQDAIRLAYAALILAAGPLIADGFIELHIDTIVGDQANTGNTTYYIGDNVHWKGPTSVILQELLDALIAGGSASPSITYGTGVEAALAINVGSAGAFLLNNGSGASLTSVNAATSTLADAGSDTTMFLVLSPDATGDRALKTKASTLTFNASTGVLSLPLLSVTTGVTGAITFDDVVTFDDNITLNQGATITGNVTFNNSILGSPPATLGATSVTTLTTSGGAGIGTASTSTSFLTIAAGTTAKSQMNLAVSSAPSSPVDGDVWREDNTNTGLKIRINGVTKTITVS